MGRNRGRGARGGESEGAEGEEEKSEEGKEELKEVEPGFKAGLNKLLAAGR